MQLNLSNITLNDNSYWNKLNININSNNNDDNNAIIQLKLKLICQI